MIRLRNINPKLSVGSPFSHMVLIQRRHGGKESLTCRSMSTTEEEILYQQFIQRPANQLKVELQGLQLDTKGRKPDLARRLAIHILLQKTPNSSDTTTTADPETHHALSSPTNHHHPTIVPSTLFPSIPLSAAASMAMTQAGFQQLTPIQSKALPLLLSSSSTSSSSSSAAASVILHAETGSGKTLCYLLPITERAWKSVDSSSSTVVSSPSKFSIIQRHLSSVNDDNDDEEEDEDEVEYALILTPNRELATQVASVAQVLAPPGSVRLIPFPTNLIRDSYELKERGDTIRLDHSPGNNRSSRSRIRILIGSAQTIYQSLFGGNGSISSPPPTSSTGTAAAGTDSSRKTQRYRVIEDSTTSSSSSSFSSFTDLNEESNISSSSSLPPPTSKPEAQYFLRKVSYLVLDEVDRLLLGTGSTSSYTRSKYYKKHEKPAAVLTATITRQTLGRVQMVAVSATVGRPLRRELARVLGVPPKEGPMVITSQVDKKVEGDDEEEGDGEGVGRIITVPSTVQHYVFPCDASTSGEIVTSAAFMIKALPRSIQGRGRRILLVVAKDAGLQVSHVVGALNHFGLQPAPTLLSQHFKVDETDALIANHHLVSKCSGLGKVLNMEEGYILVTSEDDIRGLHLNDLDTVVIAGRPKGPDEYIHIAGRTGRGGKKGQVINVVSYEQGQALTGWEKMLKISFYPLVQSDISSLDS